jgi:uncharacterized protein (DUF427 family)
LDEVRGAGALPLLGGFAPKPLVPHNSGNRYKSLIFREFEDELLHLAEILHKLVKLMRPKPITPQPSQESVWDYPRPAILEDTSKHLKVVCHGIVLAETNSGKRVLETSHPPTYYFPPENVRLECLVLASRRGVCEWKGRYEYYDVRIGDRYIPQGAWRYFAPTSSFQEIQEYYGFFANLMDSCYVNDERVIPQAGDFYGGWITSDIVGPFKGEEGTGGW